ncbi:uncharacterized protein LOC128270333 [Anopheles cruzii]|uniref:uncharacterized protein LOC128270333 n=1 Tax=Anopheles cruzii TaxID=68878 RepID=UPI0022EC7AE8|nr:uncharacterized protein LOC128270333 [Anopheles cruzii]
MTDTTDITTTNTCSACRGTLGADDVAYRCAGFCNDAFHGKCLGLPQTCRKELFRNPQLLWVCPSCSVMLEDGAMRMKSVVLRGLDPMFDRLKSDILAEFDRRFSRLVESSRSPVAVADRRTGALHAGATTDTSYAAVTKERTLPDRRHETTVASLKPPLVVGTAPKQLIKTVPAPQPRMWLFISRLSTDTTDEQVSDMVCQCLGDTDVVIRRLLARDRDIASVSFLSFKVGLPPALREKALDPATWPAGVSFREFVSKPRPNTPASGLTLPPVPDQMSFVDLSSMAKSSTPPRYSDMALRFGNRSFGSPTNRCKRPRPDSASNTYDDINLPDDRATHD